MKRDIDILSVKPADIKHTVMYEVNDSGREHEYSGGYKYIDSFTGFIESLGFEIGEKEYHGSENIIINGVKFGINTENASFMARSAYDRIGHQRKPENRYISLEIIGNKGKVVVRVRFNEEIEAEKLKNRITNAITAYHNREKEIEERKKQEEINTITIGTHYLSNPILKNAIDYIHIEKGIITFCFKKYFSVRFYENNLLKANFYVHDIENVVDLFAFNIGIGQIAADFNTAFLELRKMPPLSPELLEWAKTQYHRYFYSTTMSTEKTY